MGSVYTSLQFRLWASINGTTVDLVQFAVSYEMNTIPTCTAMLPVGYRVLPPFDPSPAHQLTGIQLQIPMQVYINIVGSAGNQPPSLPAQGTYTLFDGYVTGVGYRRTYDGFSMTVEGTHWLSDLSYSSVLSATSCPVNPTQFSFNATLSTGAGGNQHPLPQTLAQEWATTANISEDLWGEVMQPWLLALAGTDRLGWDLIVALGGNPDNDTANGDVATALGKIDGEKLPFVTDAFASGGNIAAAMIARELSYTLHPSANVDAGLAEQTFWDKIVGQYAPTYMFRLVPYPTKAKVVPFIPGLRDNWDPNGEGVTFPGRDIEVQDMSCHLPRQLRAVGIFAGRGSIAGGVLPDSTAAAKLQLGGLYMAQGVKTGMVLMRQAPSFLWDANLAYRFTDQAIKVRSNAFAHPHAGAAPTGPTTGDTKQDVSDVLNLVARAIYVNEILKDRWGDISTTLRFDVAPGSSVSMEGTAGAFGQAGETRYAQVLRVGHQFDAQQQSCRSQFKLGYIHTEGEHSQDQFTIEGHPLYTTTWPGDQHVTQDN